MNALLAQFIPEARDLLDQAGTGMLALERDAASPRIINDVFRAVHTLKGSSGLFDVAPLTRLVHAAEDLLGEVRTGELALNAEIVDRLLDSLDLVSCWIDVLETREELPGDAEATMVERVTVLRGWLSQESAPSVTAAAAASRLEEGVPPPHWLGDWPEVDRMKAFEATQGERLLAWTFLLEEDCFFRGDDPVAMVRQSPDLLAVRVRPRAPFGDVQTFDPLVANLRFEVLGACARDVLEEHMRYVNDAVEVRSIDVQALAFATGRPVSGPVLGEFARLARQHLADGNRKALERAVGMLLKMLAPESFQASALRWLQVQLRRQGLDALGALERWIGAVETGTMPAEAPLNRASARVLPPATPGAAPVSIAVKAETALARRIALEQIRVLATPCDPAAEAGRLDAVLCVMANLQRVTGLAGSPEDLEAAAQALRERRDLGPLQRLAEALEHEPLKSKRPEPDTHAQASESAALSLRSENSVPPDSLGAERPLTAFAATAAAETARAAPAAGLASDRRDGLPAAEHSSEGKAVPRVLRVDQAKIDMIMNLVAELIVAKNGLSYLATRAEQVHGSRAAAREIKDQFAVIDRITQGLQVGVMAVRMMPVSQVFQRFPRLVRDIARKLGKTIELVIEGEDTEADKNVLESLADPLIHMVRNALDHGIEMPDDRRSAGKPETGTVRITARQENDFVVIEVRDDGRGIDPAEIRHKALQQGLITAEQGGEMSEDAIANLVFAPGFSTKEKVSDLSGRGAGMDVVRSAVLRAGGEVSLWTRRGIGTAVTARLPLTMAVTRIVTIACCGHIFGIPMDVVVETVRVRRDQIHRIKTSEAFVLREAIVPMVRLAKALELKVDAPAFEAEDEAVMVVRLGRDRIGVVVDGFRERLEVIVKPLDGVLEGMAGFSGTALLGDGRVLLILDLQDLL